MSDAPTGGGTRARARRLVAMAGMILLVLSVVGEAQAQRHQDRPNADQAEAAIAQLRSPYCPGLMLEVCPSPNAAALRDSIYDLAEAGESTEEIVEWMLGRHGEEWRGVPQRSGAGLWAWIIPPLALLVGAGVVVGWLRSNRSAGRTAEVGPAEGISDVERDRLAAALREWEESGEDEA